MEPQSQLTGTKQCSNGDVGNQSGNSEDSGVVIMNSGDPIVTNKPAAPELSEGTARRAWIALFPILFCYVVPVVSLMPLTTQYLTVRVGRDAYNISLDPDAYASHEACSNASKNYRAVLNSIQRETSKINLIASVSTCVPAAFVCLVIGSYSDYLGRRSLLVASLSGGAAKVFSITAVIYWDLPLWWYYIGCFLDGAVGSAFTLTLVGTAIITDLTRHAPEKRAISFAAVEGILYACGALSVLFSGLMIHAWKFVVPACVASGIISIALLLGVVVMPETLDARNSIRTFQWSPFSHIRQVFCFYFEKGQGRRRSLYVLGLVVFLVLCLIKHGLSAVETLFVLNAPICWGPVDIGIYQSTRQVAWSVVAIVVLKLLRRRLSLEVIGICSSLSAAMGFALEGLASSGKMLYIAALVGVLHSTIIPIPRALLSQMTPQAEQGALFSGLAFVEMIGSLMANFIYTYVYNLTIGIFKGAVFILVAGLCLTCAAFILVFRTVQRRQPSPQRPGCNTEILENDYHHDGNHTSRPTEANDCGTSQIQHKQSPAVTRRSTSEITPLLK